MHYNSTLRPTRLPWICRKIDLSLRAYFSITLADRLQVLSLSQNWFRAAATQVAPTTKTKVVENNGIKAEVRNGATPGKKRGRKPKEHPPVDAPLQTQTEGSTPTQNFAPAISPSPDLTQARTLHPDPTDSTCMGQNRQAVLYAARGSKPKRLPLLE